MKMSKFKLAFAVVLISLCISVGFNVYQYLGVRHSPKTFVFTWTYKEQEYRMELTFDTVPTLTGANLSITAKINENQYYHGVSLDILFDEDGDGEFKRWDPAYVLYADNRIHWGFLNGSWSMSIPLTAPRPSPYHTCTFDKSGYTFRINFPLEELKLKNDLIYVSYGAFWTYFHFDPEGELLSRR